MKTPTHLTAEYFIEITKIPRKTFFNRVVSKGVRFLEMFRGDRLYEVKHWNKLNPDFEMPDQIDA